MTAKQSIRSHKIAEQEAARLAGQYLNTRDYCDAYRWAIAAQMHKFAARQLKLVAKKRKK